MLATVILYKNGYKCWHFKTALGYVDNKIGNSYFWPNYCMFLQINIMLLTKCIFCIIQIMLLTQTVYVFL